MNKIIEIETDILYKRSIDYYNSLDKNSLEYYNGVAIDDSHMLLTGDDLLNLKREIPWLSGKVGSIHFLPESKCQIHCDNHDDVSYHRSLNILVKSDGNNHKTIYYKYKKPGEWGDVKKDAIYRGPVEDLEVLFEFTVTKPTVFYNQILHNVENYGKSERVMVVWLIEKSITDDEILEWCRSNNINYKVVY